jgi:hypothetical protein
MSVAIDHALFVTTLIGRNDDSAAKAVLNLQVRAAAKSTAAEWILSGMLGPKIVACHCRRHHCYVQRWYLLRRHL